ncbi:C40 family peptidase [Streptomyces sp. NPDC090106]|uniref:C40 family peptidase n=1 Tax=Streptomyces sp. NPDC090106 TaxID=3365946 RepID=UPI00381AE4E3
MRRRRSRWLGAVAVMLMAGVILMAGIAAHVAALAKTQQDEAEAQRICTTGIAGVGSAGLDTDTAELAQNVNALVTASRDIRVPGTSGEQVHFAKIVTATGMVLGFPARGQIIALATALQESGLRNLSHGDSDSLGLFQQRPSQGWGTTTQIMNPVYASKKFYAALNSVNGWQTLALTDAAQTVQKSGYPDAYADDETLATQLQQAIATTMGSQASTPAATGTTANILACGQSDGSQYGAIPAGSVPDGYQIPATATPAARAAIQWALQQLGTPYQWGGNCTNPHGSQRSGRCDCSSLMQRAYGVAGVQITRTTYTQIHDGRSVSATADAVQPGDLVFTEGSASRPEHVAMAIGDGLLVHAPRPGRVVEVAKIATHGTILVVRRIA